MSDNIIVALRLRRLIERELNENIPIFWEAQNNCLVQIDVPIKKEINSYAFDKVYDENSTNTIIYTDLAHPIVQSCLAGFNGTIFAYGQTSSGKTFTMTGDSSSPGIVPLAIEHIFNSIKNDMLNREFLIRASYMEIYQENIFDLLNLVNGKCAKITTLQEDPHGQVLVPGLVEKCVNSKEMLLSVMGYGDKRRHVGETKMNERSSRSHSIFRLIIESRERGDTDCKSGVTVSHLNLVDLAGSENASQTGAVGERLKEGSSINKSLFMLGRVISQLSEREAYINFRDSKLTRILQNSLGGNAKTVVICTVTPATREQTLSTVRFASRAKSIINKPKVNEVLSEAALLKRNVMDIKRLTVEKDEMQEKLEKLEKRILEQNELSYENFVVSSQSTKHDDKKDAKERRKTWGGAALRKSRMSMAPAGQLASVSFPEIQNTFHSFPQKSFFLPEILEEGQESASSDKNCSVASFDGNSDIEELLNKNELSSPRYNFLSPRAIPVKRRKKKVIFLESFENESKDSESQTDMTNPLLQSRLYQTPPTQPSLSPCITPGEKTPRDVLRSMNAKLREFLEAKDIVLEDWQNELQELEEFHKNELSSMSQTYQTEIEQENKVLCLESSLKDSERKVEFLEKSLRHWEGHEDKVSVLEKSLKEWENKVKFLEKSLEDSDSLYLEANKTVHEQSLEMKALKERINILEKDNGILSKASKDNEIYVVEIQDLKKQLKENKEHITFLENDRLDFDMKMELALEKHNKTEEYLRSSLNDAWEEIAVYEKGSFVEVRDRKSKLKTLESDLAASLKKVEELNKENENLRQNVASLQQQFENSIEDLSKERCLTAKLTTEFEALEQEREELRKSCAEHSVELQKIKERPNYFNETTMYYTCEDKYPFEQSCLMNMSATTNPSEVSRKLSETLQYLDETLLASSIPANNEQPGGFNLKEIKLIRDQLLELRETLLAQEIIQLNEDARLSSTSLSVLENHKPQTLEEKGIEAAADENASPHDFSYHLTQFECPKLDGNIISLADELKMAEMDSTVTENLADELKMAEMDSTVTENLADELKMAEMDSTVTENCDYPLENKCLNQFIGSPDVSFIDLRMDTKDVKKEITDIKERTSEGGCQNVEFRENENKSKENVEPELREMLKKREEEINELRERKMIFEDQLVSLRGKDKSKESEEHDWQKIIMEQEQEISELREKKKCLENQLVELREKDKSLDEESKSKETLKTKEEEEINELKERKTSLENQLSELRDENKSLESEAHEIQETLKKQEQEIKELKQKEKSLESHSVELLGNDNSIESDDELRETLKRQEVELKEFRERERCLANQIVELRDDVKSNKSNVYEMPENSIKDIKELSEKEKYLENESIESFENDKQLENEEHELREKLKIQDDELKELREKEKCLENQLVEFKENELKSQETLMIQEKEIKELRKTSSSLENQLMELKMDSKLRESEELSLRETLEKQEDEMKESGEREKCIGNQLVELIDKIKFKENEEHKMLELVEQEKIKELREEEKCTESTENNKWSEIYELRDTLKKQEDELKILREREQYLEIQYFELKDGMNSNESKEYELKVPRNEQETEVKELTEKEECLEKQLAESVENINKSPKSEEHELRETLNKQDELKDLRENVKYLENELARLREDNKLKENEGSELHDKVKTQEEKIKELRDQLAELIDDNKLHECKESELRESLKKHEKESKELMEKRMNLENQFAELRENNRSKEMEEYDLRKTLKEQEQEIQELKEKEKFFENQLENEEKSVENNGPEMFEIKELREKRMNLEQQLAELKENDDKMMKEVFDLRAREEEFHKTVNELQARENELENKLAEMNDDKKKMEKKCLVLEEELEKLKLDKTNVNSNETEALGPKVTEEILEQSIKDLKKHSKKIESELSDMKEKEKELTKELTDMKDKEDELESMITDFTLKEEQLEEKEAELVERETKCKEIIQEQAETVHQFEVKVSQLEKELELTRKSLKEKSAIHENDDNYQEICDLVMTRDEINELVKEKNALSSDLDTLQEIISSYEFEAKVFEEKKLKLENKFHRVQCDLDSAKQENERLNSRCVALCDELEKMRERKSENSNRCSSETIEGKSPFKGKGFEKIPLTLDHVDRKDAEVHEENILVTNLESGIKLHKLESLLHTFDIPDVEGIEKELKRASLLSNEIFKLEEECKCLKLEMDSLKIYKDKMMLLSTEVDLKHVGEGKQIDEKVLLDIEERNNKDLEIKALKENIRQLESDKDDRIKENDIINERIRKFNSVLLSCDCPDIEHLEERLQKTTMLTFELTAATNDCDSLKSEVNALRIDYEAVKSEINELKDEKHKKEKKENELLEEIKKTKLHNDCGIQITGQSENLDILKTEMLNMITENSKLDREVQMLNVLLESFGIPDLQGIEKELKKMALLLQELDETKKECEKFRSKNETLIMDSERMRTSSKDELKEINQMKCAEEKKLREEIGERERVCQEKENLLKILRKEIASLNDEHKATNDKLRKLDQIFDKFNINGLDSVEIELEKVSALSDELNELKKECDAQKSDIDLLSSDQDTLVQTLQEHVDVLQEKEDIMKGLETDLDSVRKAHEGCIEKGVKSTLEIENYINIIEKYESEVSEKDENNQKLSSENKDLKLEVKDLRKELKAAEDRQQVYKVELEATKENVITLKAQLEIMEKEHEKSKECNLRLEESLRSITLLETSLTNIQYEKEHLEIKLREKNEDYNSLRRKHENEVKDLEENMAQLRHTIYMLNKKQNELESSREGAVDQNSSEFGVKIQSLHQENESLMDLTEKTKSELQEKSKEYTDLSDEYDRAIDIYEQKIDDFKDIIKTLKQKNKSLNETLKSQSSLEPMNITNSTPTPTLTPRLQVTNHEAANQEIMKRFNILKVENSKLIHVNINLKEQIDTLNEFIKGCQDKNVLLSKEMCESKKKNDFLNEKLQNSQEQNELLNAKLNDAKTLINTLQNSSLTVPPNTTRKSSTQQSKQMLMEKVEKMNVEIYELRNEVVNLRTRDGIIGSNEELEKQLKFMRTKMAETECLNNTLNSNYDLLEEELAELKDKNQQLEAKLEGSSSTLKLEGRESPTLYAQEQQEEICKLRIENNVLKMHVERLKAPIQKDLHRCKEELKFEQENNKKLMVELRRVQNENICDASMIDINPQAKKLGPPKKKDEPLVGYGSKIVLDVQVMELKNINYHLEKEKAQLTNENKVLKEHVQHYKSKAEEWKTKCYKTELKLKTCIVPKNEKNDEEDNKGPSGPTEESQSRVTIRRKDFTPHSTKIQQGESYTRQQNISLASRKDPLPETSHSPPGPLTDNTLNVSSATLKQEQSSGKENKYKSSEKIDMKDSEDCKVQ